MSTTLTNDELRELFLFEALDEDQLGWLRKHGEVVTRAAGETVSKEGDPATCFFVLLEGTILLSRNIGGDTVEINRTDHVGSYFGATQAYLDPKRTVDGYGASVQAVTDLRLFQLPADEFGFALRSWFPMAMHLLDGLFMGMQNS